jgi:hypothetical protein
MKPRFLMLALIPAAGALLVHWLIPNRDSSPWTDSQSCSQTVLAAAAIADPITSDKYLFEWSQIESKDLAAYVSRLRAIGCPEETIRDIIAGIVNRSYEPKLSAMRREAAAPFWMPLERRSGLENEQHLKRQMALREMERQRDEVIQNLLGMDAVSHLTQASAKPDRFTAILDDLELSDAVRPITHRILQHYNEIEQAISRRAGGTLGLQEQADLEQVYERKVEDLGQVLGPQELEEFELRASPLAHRLRTADLVGFSPTEEEFRNIFRICKAYEREINAASGHPDSMAVQAGLLHDRELHLRQVLGDKRFAGYQRSQDHTYRQLAGLASHYGLGLDAAAEVHDLREAVIKRVWEFQDARLDYAARKLALEQIHSEAVEAVRESLGDEAYAAYLRAPYGSWLTLVPTWTNGVAFRN